MKATLIEKREEAKGTVSFFWKPEKAFKYSPGQYLYYTLPSLVYPDDRGPTHEFTISSSPTEGELIRLTTRIREQSGYKKTLNSLTINSIVDIRGPEGEFVLDGHEKGPHVFVAGGIGITPFRSMIKYSLDRKLEDEIILIYSNSFPEEITFRDELTKWSNEPASFKLYMTITKTAEESRGQTRREKWQGLTGRIDEAMIEKLTSQLVKPTFWVCGPPLMVDAMNQVLQNLSISKSFIRTEKFGGY